MVAHVDPELLAAHALGAQLPHEAGDHVATCADCAGEMRSLSDVVRLGRDLAGDDRLIEPPARVWAAIAGATGVDPAGLDEASRSLSRSGDGLANGNGMPQVSGTESARTVGGRRIRWVLAAAVAGVLAGGAAVAGWQELADGENTVVVAQASLDPVTSAEVSGTAAVVEADGQRQLRVDLVGAGPPDGYLEVWLLAPDASGLVSLGVLPEQTARLPVPDGLDLAAFPVVDVSVEPFDGDPAHSGDSLVRGQFADQ